jgi:hypothetical protein
MRLIDSFSTNQVQTEAKAYFESLGYPNVYFGGFNQIEIEWVEPGTQFRIDEYDGSESLELLGEAGFITLH